MDKSTVSRAFNNTLTEFLTEVMKIVPENTEVRKTKVYLEMIRTVNPSLVIKVWWSHLYTPYSNQIDAGDITYFIEKEYTEDINALQHANDVLQGIQRIREQIRTMSDENKSTSMRYIQKLSQLSQLYQGTA